MTLVGLAIPFLARLARAPQDHGRLLKQYVDTGLPGMAFLELLNLVPIAAAVVSTMLFRRRAAWLLPVIAGYAYVGYWHARLDLASDAQAAFGLLYIPVMSLWYFAGGALVAAWIDRWFSSRESRIRRS